MKFIEMSGGCLADILSEDELEAEDLRSAGVGDTTIIRVNQQGDIEVRRSDRWDIVGGLIGDFYERIRKKTGLDWA